jgi:hypothetical protein
MPSAPLTSLASSYSSAVEPALGTANVLMYARMS